MNAALNTIPEGFSSTTPQASLIFQSTSNWLKANSTGVMVQGTYEGLTDADSYGKINFKFTATAPGTTFGKDGSERSFGEGSTIIINTSAGLAKKLADIEVGEEVVVRYAGQNKLTSGAFKGKMAHSYEVFTRG